MGYRVLVVDDSPVLRIMLTDMLKDLGHQVVGEADCGEKAIAAFREHKPDLVTLDISLPDMDGLQVLQRLRRVDLGAKVLIVTGNDQRAVERQAMDLKALGVLHKPFDEAELKAMLDRIAGGVPRRDRK